ncbi:MAG: FAD binding domain-containing protein [Treponema sp.]|jgi:CO/xanthine dehydrogenase FAD-binding subunit|nr:FAD binding domain-containing protein [Treponema sp.]
MAASEQTLRQVLRPGTLPELFASWSRFPGAVPFAGGTELIRRSGNVLPSLPAVILSLEKLDELRRITRTERYLEIGAMVRLSEIIALEKSFPEALSAALRGIAGPQARNLATTGGSVCTGGDTAAPLAALDARYELRSAAGGRWVSALRFSPAETLGERELLTRIRIPLAEWNYTVYRKFHPGDSGGEGGILVLLARNQKDLLSKIQAVAWTGGAPLREKNSETFLEGKALPLDRRDARHYGKLWENYLNGLGRPGPLLRSKIVNSIEAGILGLAD